VLKGLKIPRVGGLQIFFQYHSAQLPANSYLFSPALNVGYFESLGKQDLQNTLPHFVSEVYASSECLCQENVLMFRFVLFG